MTSTLCTARECFWQDDCRRHAYNNAWIRMWQAYRDYSRDIVVKDGMKMPCQYFEQMGDKNEH